LFHPVAVGTVEEVTNRLKLLTSKGRLRRLSEQTGRNKSERRAGLETNLADSDLADNEGRPPPSHAQGPSNAPNNPVRRVHRGSGDGTFARKRTQHGRPIPAAAARQLGAREGKTGAGVGVGSAHSTGGKANAFP